MDTVQEENSQSESSGDEKRTFLHPPEIMLTEEELEMCNSQLSSRRPSAIIAALRRPSQSAALSAAHVIMNQRNYLLNVFQSQNDHSAFTGEGRSDNETRKQRYSKVIENDALTTMLSALYAKLLVVLGIAFPITELIATEVEPFYYQSFYLYLNMGSIAFVIYMYGLLIWKKSTASLHCPRESHKSYQYCPEKKVIQNDNDHHHHPIRYGSFYLRLGAIAFGIGSMVYSGLLFGRYFEIRNHPQCHSTLLQAITPATKMVLTLVQIQFIFLNSQDLEMNRHKVVSRFGLMHMIAANLCEWLYILVEETRHEIIHLEEHHSNSTSKHAKFCQEGQVMGSLITNASSFLFPCKIEYSLICAVILFEMWKSVRVTTKNNNNNNKSPADNKSKTSQQDKHLNRLNVFHPPQSEHHFRVDCSKSHKGLFAGILVIVLTIISLIMFFVLINENGTRAQKLTYKTSAEYEVIIVEIVLYTISLIAVLVAMIQMRNLKYRRKGEGIGLDSTLLLVGQTGMFIYCMFSMIGCYFTSGSNSTPSLIAEAFSFVQTCLQTIFILDGCWRRCRNLQQTRTKPGRELITFLIITNMAMWTINTLEKNRAELRPFHLQFFGEWAWTIITHISMPLAIFYRFHSTICLFEIWKGAYKIKTPYKHHTFFPYL